MVQIGIVADTEHHNLAQRAHTELNDPTLSEEQHWLESFRLLAIECKIDIVVGTIVEKAKVIVKDSEGKEIEKEVLHNVCHYIDSEGVILGECSRRIDMDNAYIYTWKNRSISQK